jgi:hypothetical protein
MNRSTTDTGRLPLRAALVAAVLALLTGCGGTPDVAPKHSGIPDTAAGLCALYSPEEVMSFVGIEQDAYATPSADRPDVRWCDYRTEPTAEPSDWVRIELRPYTREAFDTERESWFEAPPKEGQPMVADLPGVGDSAFGGPSRGSGGDGNLFAFHRDTRIMIYASKASSARLGELANKLISDTQVR